MLCTFVIFSNSSFAFMAGLLTTLLYFLAFVRYAFTLHPEEAECTGLNSGAHIGEHLLTKDSFFLSFFLDGLQSLQVTNQHHCMLCIC